MARLFTAELGAEMHQKILDKNWKVIYEYRNHGKEGEFQSIEEIFKQVADTITTDVRYRVYPAKIPFETFISGVINDTIQLPRVMIDGESRILFGFGIREDHCYFVTNSSIQMQSADRQSKDFQFMLDALDTLEEFSIDNRP